ncbi:DnaJ family domain-containing protein [Alteribacter aurantiacus]|uniref:DnaJ family domain-containing protein n=1 Tax=Alteribacter aurantiacus TaxID=254410 RepID=UPI0004225D07|nr:DnaJ family domain-containing protein [Alteribacter aurantiacus]
MKDWFGDIYKKHEGKGDFDYLEGKGKPLKREVLEGDVLDRTFKSANVVPDWIERRRKVMKEMETLIALKDHMEPDDYSHRIEQINDLIRKYNKKCPPVMQRGLISPNNLEQRYRSWQ